MKILRGMLALSCVLAVAVSLADGRPAPGRFLVATEAVAGSSFERTVILLLHYDDAGAQGLVINRPTDTGAGNVFPDSDIFSRYSDEFFWGGPVSMASMRALLRTDEPPADAIEIIAGVYQVPLDDGLNDYRGNAMTLRFYLGYAGWGPGQLDRELKMGSWAVVAASADIVFAANPAIVWEMLRPVPEYRARLLLP